MRPQIFQMSPQYIPFLLYSGMKANISVATIINRLIDPIIKLRNCYSNK